MLLKTHMFIVYLQVDQRDPTTPLVPCSTHGRDDRSIVLKNKLWRELPGRLSQHTCYYYSPYYYPAICLLLTGYMPAIDRLL